MTAPPLTLRVVLTYHDHVGGHVGHANGYAEETDPRLTLFLTHGLSGGQMTTKLMPLDKAHGKGQRHRDTHKRVTFDLPFYTQPPPAIRQAAAGWLLGGGKDLLAAADVLPASAALGMNGYVVTHAETGQVCESRAGSAYVPLHRLLNGASYDKAEAMDFWLADNTPDDGIIIKGRVRIVSATLLRGGSMPPDPLLLRGGDGSIELRFGPATAGTVRPPSASGMPDTGPQERMMAIVQKSMHVFVGRRPLFAGPTIPYLSRIHCPEYRTEVMSLPGSAYAARLPLHEPSLDVYEHLLDIVLWRDGDAADAARLAETLERQLDRVDDIAPAMEFHNATVLLVSLLTLVANTDVYVNDFAVEGIGRTIVPAATRRNIRARMQASRAHGGGAVDEDDEAETPITEAYKIAWRMGGGDCEDVAFVVYMMAAQLLALRIADADAVRPLVRLLRALQRVLALYLPMLVLAAVTNKKLELGPGIRDMAADQAMAHTFAMFMPFAIVADGLAADFVPQEAAVLRTSRFWRDGERMRRPWHRHLRTLVCEGTARMKGQATLPFSYWAASASDVRDMQAQIDAQQRAQAASKLRNIGMAILPRVMADTPGRDYAADRRDISGFYKAPVSAYVAHSFRDVGIYDLAFALGGGVPPPDPLLRGRRGDTSQPMTYGAHFNYFVFPELRPRLRFVPYNRLADEDVAIINDALLQLEPEPALQLRQGGGVVDTPAVLLDALASFPQSTSRVSGGRSPSIVLTIRDQDLAMPETLADLTTAIKAVVAGNRACAIDVKSWRLIEPAVADDDMLRMIVHDVRISLPPVD